jgi:hypothetical protein
VYAEPSPSTRSRSWGQGTTQPSNVKDDPGYHWSFMLTVQRGTRKGACLIHASSEPIGHIGWCSRGKHHTQAAPKPGGDRTSDHLSPNLHKLFGRLRRKKGGQIGGSIVSNTRDHVRRRDQDALRTHHPHPRRECCQAGWTFLGGALGVSSRRPTRHHLAVRGRGRNTRVQKDSRRPAADGDTALDAASHQTMAFAYPTSRPRASQSAAHRRSVRTTRRHLTSSPAFKP